MRFSSPKKALLAVGAAGAVVAMMAGPAAAAVNVTASFDNTSSLTLHPGDSSADIVFDFDGTPTACGTGAPSSIDLGLDDPSNGLIDLDVADYNIQPGTLRINSVDYRASIVGASDTTGTISTTASGAVSVDIKARVIVSDCDGTVELCRTNPISLPLNGTHNTTAAGGTRTGTASVSGSTVTNGIKTSFGCNAAIRPVLNNAEADLNLDLTLT